MKDCTWLCMVVKKYITVLLMYAPAWWQLMLTLTTITTTTSGNVLKHGITNCHLSADVRGGSEKPRLVIRDFSKTLVKNHQNWYCISCNIF